MTVSDMAHAAGFDATSALLGAQTNYQSWYFTRMLHDSGLFHAAMAICLAQMRMLSISADVQGAQQLSYHRGCAIVSVQHRLQDLTQLGDNAVIETIITLANIEVSQRIWTLQALSDKVQLQCQDYDSFEQHLRGLRTLLGLLGNLESLDRHLVAFLV